MEGKRTQVKNVLVLSILFFLGCAVNYNFPIEEKGKLRKEYIVKKPTYLVIDLSGGPNATSYPIEYFDAVPSGGWNDIYKMTKLVLRIVPKGIFTMGSPLDEKGRLSNEKQHQVMISDDFWIGVFEVTERQWELVMRSNFIGGMQPKESVSYNMIRGSSSGSNWPLNSAVDASSFIGKLREKTGLQFDLPTEAQWEYACRAGTTTALNNSKNLTSEEADSNMAEIGRYSYNQDDGKGEESLGPTTVGEYLPNKWGIYDMHGNIWEWCLDWYGELESVPVKNPVGASSGSGRVLRGGCWDLPAKYCRSAYRNGADPSYDWCCFGFRLVISPITPQLGI